MIPKRLRKLFFIIFALSFLLFDIFYIHSAYLLFKTEQNHKLDISNAVWVMITQRGGGGHRLFMFAFLQTCFKLTNCECIYPSYFLYLLQYNKKGQGISNPIPLFQETL